MKKTHKLLAVVMWLGSAQANADTPRTLGSGAPACGNTMGKKGPSEACRAEYRLIGTEAALADAKNDLLTAKANEVAYTSAYLTTPRVLANGAPACGNVMIGKGGEKPECSTERAELQNLEREARMKRAIAQTAKARLRVHEAAQSVEAVRLATQPAVARGTEVARR